MPLPLPEDWTSMVLRTDFSDDAAWDALQATIRDTSEGEPPATYVSDPRFTDVSVQALISEDNDDGNELGYVFLADATTMTTPSSLLLLAVDLNREPGRTFRVPASLFWEVSINLFLANVDFADFANVADGSGIYRGVGQY